MRFSAEGTISDRDINGDKHGEKLRAKFTLSKSGKIVRVASNQREIIYLYLTRWEVSSFLLASVNGSETRNGRNGIRTL